MANNIYNAIKGTKLALKDLNITKKEYKSLLKSLNYKISHKTSNKSLRKNIQKVLDNENEYASLLKNLADIRKIKVDDDIIGSIYRDLHKKKQKVIHDLLLKLKLLNIAEKENISSKDLNLLRDLNKLNIKDLKKK